MMDSYRHKGLRARLVAEIQGKGITNERVLQAMDTIPRHLFLDSAFAEQAYMDKALPIGAAQTISQPYTVAYQTMLLDPQPTDTILEVGTGSGYQAAVLSLLCKKIYTIERQKSLYEYTAPLLIKLGYVSIRTLFGDGFLGSTRFAPFDKIIVTAGAEEVPPALKDQLKIGGQLVIPAGPSQDKRMLRLTKLSEDSYDTETFEIFRFVPLLKGVTTV